MKFQAQSHRLKSQEPVCIRKAQISDARALLDLKKSYINGSTTIPLYLQEYPDDLQNEEHLISSYLESKNSILLLAELDNELVGNIDLTGSNRAKMWHTAMIGMGIKKQSRNQGLGKILIKSVLDWATENATLELIWLDVYDSNTLGVNLYKNMGFTISGQIPGFFKEKSAYQSKIQMYKHLGTKV